MAHLDESNWDPGKSLRFFLAKKMEGRIKPQCSIKTLPKDVIFGSVFSKLSFCVQRPYTVLPIYTLLPYCLEGGQSQDMQSPSLHVLRRMQVFMHRTYGSSCWRNIGSWSCFAAKTRSSRCWFRCFFIFNPTRGNDPIR